MSRKTHGVWLLAAILVGAGVQANASSIVADGGFETGTENSYPPGPMGDGWVVTAGTGAICNQITQVACGNAGDAHTGVQMAFLDWSNSLNTITQTLTTVAGQTYEVSFFVASGQANPLEVTFGGSTLFSGTATSGGNYVKYSFDSTATSTSTLLAFSGERVGGVELLDDVSVTATPEPSMTWLLGAFMVVALLGVGRSHLRSDRAN